MATESKSSSAKAQSFDGGAFADVMSSWQNAFGGAQPNGFAAAERLAEETFRFWARRMNAYADHFSTLQQCQGPAELADASTQFINQTMADYAEETGQFVKLSQDAASSSAKKAAKAASSAKQAS
ncbi:MAG: hypothetical protein Tsb0016_25980 [Sphingomonadales bacterium]